MSESDIGATSNQQWKEFGGHSIRADLVENARQVATDMVDMFKGQLFASDIFLRRTIVEGRTETND